MRQFPNKCKHKTDGSTDRAVVGISVILLKEVLLRQSELNLLAILGGSLKPSKEKIL